jgi:hypothetical protein
MRTLTTSTREEENEMKILKNVVHIRRILFLNTLKILVNF